MLVALNDDGKRIYAKEVTRRKDNFYCPECGERLIFRRGLKNIPHFAHTGDSICIFRKGGESQIHNFMKEAIKGIIERDNYLNFSELEWKINSDNGEYVIADYYFEKKDKWGNKKRCAVECVHKHQDLSHFLNKNEFYLENGIFPLWFFNLDKFLDNDGDFRESVRINAIMKEAHKINFGKVWALDYKNKAVYAIHFNRCESYVEERNIVDWDSLMSEYESTGEWQDEDDYVIKTVGGYTKYLQGTIQPVWKYVKKFDINSYSKIKKDDWCDYDRMIASPFIKPFWKKEESSVC